MYHHLFVEVLGKGSSEWFQTSQKTEPIWWPTGRYFTVQCLWPGQWKIIHVLCMFVNDLNTDSAVSFSEWSTMVSLHKFNFNFLMITRCGTNNFVVKTYLVAIFSSRLPHMWFVATWLLMFHNHAEDSFKDESPLPYRPDGVSITCRSYFGRFSKRNLLAAVLKVGNSIRPSGARHRRLASELLL